MVSKEKQLRSQIEEAFSAGNNQLGLKLLRSLSSLRPGDPEIYYRLAVIEEQIGSPEGALSAYLKCLAFAPNNPLAFLYSGYCLQQQGRLDEALALYSFCADINEGILALWQDQSTPSETRLRSDAANKTLRKYLSDMHRDSVGLDDCNQRIADAIWTRTHNHSFKFAEAQQKPQLFYVPELTPIRYAAIDQCDSRWSWVRQLEASAEAIKQELLLALPEVREKGRPYLPQGMKLDAGFSPLIGSLNWTALDLYKDGELNQDVAPYFPVTLAALTPEGLHDREHARSTSGAPLYRLHDTPFEVFFSLLKPGQHIKPHHGLSNHSLTVHLPLLVPDNCWLRVAGEKHIWRQGELVAFDDTFEHEAKNASTEERVLLIFSIWHPDLSIEEQNSIQRSFRAREKWRAARRIPLAD